jgi:UDP-sulfoquinovose synthase
VVSSGAADAIRRQGVRMMATANPKKVLVFGGDGFCGWPTALHLSDEGHDVVIVDNLSRRNIDVELGCDSLTPIQPMDVRIKAWKEVSGKDIAFHNIDVAKDYAEMVQLLEVSSTSSSFCRSITR